MSVLPDFLLVGASKSGTSSIYHYLRQHPEIFLSDVQKEGRYFSQMEGNFSGPGDTRVDATITRNPEQYKALFQNCKNEKAVGDISPEYLYFHEKAIPLIKKVLGADTKIIIILRSPVERAFSGYLHFKRDKRETLSFEQALEKEEERKQKNWIWAWQYKNSGLYYEQVKAYLDNFTNVKVIVFDDLREQPQKVLAEICAFIGVNPGFDFDTSYKYNVSGTPKNQALYKLETSRKFVIFLKKLMPKKLAQKLKNRLTGEKQMEKEEMLPETRKQLIEFFRDDILKLEKLIQKDLSHWLK
ncbi:Sulfotransferase domain-containing protein [Tangfeifania diversioriginum]|uniref:Sulfotransferase domain-containing protein n=1 Tax=Tangfeifania diversioriginum TaxID=1168035 RepID=A0A1M6GN45_9BACT|nr:sulfotransferase [Tangfeifania diversioriginum]SHJ11351.1 Sulfotransferase domain-containing protein [Tangfeifania diversioriginum]